ncbi:hypothetical protein LXA43DRAFT_1065328, partial [Ganoderma leucocontextum]
YFYCRTFNIAASAARHAGIPVPPKKSPNWSGLRAGGVRRIEFELSAYTERPGGNTSEKRDTWPGDRELVVVRRAKLGWVQSATERPADEPFPSSGLSGRDVRRGTVSSGLGNGCAGSLVADRPADELFPPSGPSGRVLQHDATPSGIFPPWIRCGRRRQGDSDLWCILGAGRNHCGA